MTTENTENASESFVTAARAAAQAKSLASEAHQAYKAVLSGAYKQRLISIVQYANALHDLRKEVDERFRYAWGSQQ